jgi:hypothetical protein
MSTMNDVLAACHEAEDALAALKKAHAHMKRKCRDLKTQRDSAVGALVCIKQDLQSNGEVYGTDDKRIQRINEGIKAAGHNPTDSDPE